MVIGVNGSGQTKNRLEPRVGPMGDFYPRKTDPRRAVGRVIVDNYHTVNNNYKQ